MAIGHFLLGSHNHMVTALGSCVKWPLVRSPSLAMDRLRIFYKKKHLQEHGARDHTI